MHSHHVASLLCVCQREGEFHVAELILPHSAMWVFLKILCVQFKDSVSVRRYLVCSLYILEVKILFCLMKLFSIIGIMFLFMLFKNKKLANMKVCKFVFLYFTKMKKKGENLFRLLSLYQPYLSNENFGPCTWINWDSKEKGQ